MTPLRAQVVGVVVLALGLVTFLVLDLTGRAVPGIIVAVIMGGLGMLTHAHAAYVSTRSTSTSSTSPTVPPAAPPADGAP